VAANAAELVSMIVSIPESRVDEGGVAQRSRHFLRGLCKIAQQDWLHVWRVKVGTLTLAGVVIGATTLALCVIGAMRARSAPKQLVASAREAWVISVKEDA